jgi:hypothetical protein
VTIIDVYSFSPRRWDYDVAYAKKKSKPAAAAAAAAADHKKAGTKKG